MLNCDYYYGVLESSSDSKPFLETIEAVSMSHGDSSFENRNFHDALDSNACYISNIHSRSSVAVKTEPDDSSCPNPWNSASFLTLDDTDKLNMTDCDLNLLVDPRTGVPIFDCSDSGHPELDMEDLDVVTPVSENELQPIADKGLQQLATDTTFQCVQAEMDEVAVVEPSSADLNTIQNNNRLVLIQIASPTSNSTISLTKPRKPDGTSNGQSQLKSLLVQDERFDKPPFSYSCLIAMALKNSDTGFLPVSEIYSYIVDKFPYFRTAPDGWKNSIRHNLSLNKCFQKVETPSLNGTTRKACLWGLNEAKVSRLDEEIAKWLKRTSDNRQESFTQVSEKLEWEENNKESDSVILDDFQTSISATTAGTITWVGQRSATSAGKSGATTISRLVEPNDIRLFRLVKVATNNCQQEQTILPSLPVVKQEPVVTPTVVHIVPNDFTVLEQPLSPGDPFFAGLTVQNGLWDDLTETNELRAAAAAFVGSQSGQANQHSACRSRLTNDSPITLKTVRASA